MVGVVVERHEELGGQHDVVTPALERLSDDDLGFAARIHVGGVHEIDAGVQGAVDDADALVVILGAPVTEHHGAQAEFAHRYAGPAERSVFHT
jgi:hypothetical protein